MDHDLQNENIDRLERLINRRLDAQNTSAEEAELDALLAADPDAREMAAEYLRLDQCAAQVLRTDAAQYQHRPMQVSSSGWRRGIAAALLSAAAVIAFSFVPDFWKSSSISLRVASSIKTPTAQPATAIDPSATRFVDYRPSDFSPVQRQRGLQRDVIGVRGDNPDVIYVFERNTLSTRLVPISGDF
jgi:hypothetical protein